MTTTRNAVWHRTRSARSRTGAKVLAGVAALGLLLVGCSSSDDASTISSSGSAPLPEQVDMVKAPAGAPKMGGTLKVGLEAETDGWDPTKNRWANSAYTVAGSFYDPLFIVDQDFKPKPYLAETMTPNADFTQWDMKLRSGVKFHDGTPLTAAWVAEFLMKYKAAPLTAASVRAMTSATASDELTVHFTMSEPWSAFPYVLTAQGGFVPAPSVVNNADGSRNPVGTGPFTFVSWTTDKLLSVKKNPTYWRQGMPYLDAIEYTPIPDSGSRVNSLKAGNIDLMITALNSRIKQLEDEGKAGNIQVTHSKGDQDASMVLINTEQAPMDDIRVRQAMAYAIDRDTLAAVTETPDGLRATSLYTKDSKWYWNPGDYYPFDLAKAKSLVEDYKKDKGALSFTFGTTNDPEVQKAVTAILGMWQAAGMDVKTDTVEQSSFITNAVTGKYTVQIWRQFGAPDPDANAVWWLSENASGSFTLNMARNKDPKIDAALKEGRSTLDEAKRKAAYDTVQQQQKADLPYIWLSYNQWTMGAANKLRGIENLTLPDGSKSIGLINGTYPVAGIWIE